MNGVATSGSLKRKDDRIIIHFDYDCFYASVVEAENPALKTQPLAIQQKQIIVTCNYEARRRGLHKLQLITEAKRVCPDVVIVLGEDLTRFRDASKALYNILRAFSWSQKVERLGFDEVWMDTTDMVDYNFELLNDNDLSHSFFCLDKSDPTQGFAFDASALAGHAYPPARDEKIDASGQRAGANADTLDQDAILKRRLVLGSHLARHLRHILEQQMGYTCTVGISTSKLISKLVGNLNKPKGQTTLLPPYDSDPAMNSRSNISTFVDAHDVGKVPYIGFKLAQKLRELVLGRAAEFSAGLVYGPTRENVTVGDVRAVPDLSPEMLEKLLAGPGMQHGIGFKVYSLIHGIDGSEVAAARNIPRQISIEDSYIRLNIMEHVLRELTSLSKRLIERMRMDLMDEDGWMAKPSTVRLTTRPRPPLNADGSRSRAFNRISRSTQAPYFIFQADEDSQVLAHRLVNESLVSLFKKLHPERDGWNLSLVNVAVIGMIEKQDKGADISSIFKKQDEVKREFETEVLPFVEDDLPDAGSGDGDTEMTDSLSMNNEQAEIHDMAENWDEDSEEEQTAYRCPQCGSGMPLFARTAHQRFHDLAR